MKIKGCDYHPGFQRIAFVDTDTWPLRRGKSNYSSLSRIFCCP